MATDHSDTLRLHSIIQRFFRTKMGAPKEVAFWLERAVAVFCRSFDVADSRIRRTPGVGLPEDYRRYSIQGQQILAHVDRHTKKHAALVSCRVSVIDRLDMVEQSIANLTRAVSSDLKSRRTDRRSVFEMSSSSCSDSDSSRTSERYTPDREEDEGKGWMIHEEMAVLESPAPYDDLGHHPWDEFPYPQVNMMPMPPLPEDMDLSDTEYIGTPRPRPQTTFKGKTKEDLVNHRTVKKMEERRYHDRKGSMRYVKGGPYSDVRVSVNVDHEPPKARMFNSMPSDLTEDEVEAAKAERAKNSKAKSQLLRISSSQSLGRGKEKSKTLPNGGNKSASPFLQFFAKALRKSPVAQSDVTWSPSASTVRVGEHDTPRPERMTPSTQFSPDPNIQSPSHGGSPPIRTPSQDSWAYHHDRMSKSELVQGTTSPPSSNQPSKTGRKRGDSAPPVWQVHTNEYLDDEDLRAGLPVDIGANPHAGDVTVWNVNLRPTGYSSQPMSRQTSDNPNTGSRQGATAQSLGSSFPPAVLRAIPLSDRPPSHIETEPSPRLVTLADAGPSKNWEERHAIRGRARFSSSIPASRLSHMSPSRISNATGSRPVSRGEDEGPGSGGILTGNGSFVSFGNNATEAQSQGPLVEPDEEEGSRTQTRQTQQDRDQALLGVGLGIIEG